jgi:hypothetical protein
MRLFWKDKSDAGNADLSYRLGGNASGTFPADVE